MPIVTETDKFRLLLGDTPAAHGLPLPRPVPPLPDPEFTAVAILNDQEIGYFLGLYTDVRLAVAAAADSLALRFSNAIKTFKVNDKSFERFERSKGFTALATRLRAEVAAEAAAAAAAASDPALFNVAWAGTGGSIGDLSTVGPIPGPLTAWPAPVIVEG